MLESGLRVRRGDGSQGGGEKAECGVDSRRGGVIAGAADGERGDYCGIERRVRIREGVYAQLSRHALDTAN